MEQNTATAPTLTPWDGRLLEVGGHCILGSEIIGIGPVMLNKIGNTIEQQLYNSYQLSFDVHCKAQSITVRSNVLYREGADDRTLQQHKAEHRAFWDGYKDAKEKIIEKSAWISY